MTTRFRSAANVLCGQIVTAVLLAGLMPCGRGEVRDAGPQHFTIESSVSVKTSPDEAWQRLVEIGTWWGADHTWSGDSANLKLTLVPGGGWDETLPNGGFVRHMSVIYCQPAKMLRLSGVLGPLQEHALQGTLTITLTASGEETTITTRYHVAGHFPGGLDKVAPVVDKVLSTQFNRLAARINGSKQIEPER